MTPLVEREREVTRLSDLVDAVADGEGHAVLIEGPAGIRSRRELAVALDAGRGRAGP